MMEENKMAFVQYWFKKKLSFMDKCKIIVHFSNEYENYEWNFYLKHKSNDTCIQIEDGKITFINMNAKEALKKYEEIASILFIKDAGGAE